jgi:hypothetical protein
VCNVFWCRSERGGADLLRWWAILGTNEMNHTGMYEYRYV